MILSDTPVWIDHLRIPDQRMFEFLNRGRILCHPFVVGEIAVGMFRGRDKLIDEMQRLPMVTVATDQEVLTLISDHKLYGSGVGYIDMHLLTSVLLTPDARLWTTDRRLNNVAQSFGVSYTATP